MKIEKILQEKENIRYHEIERKDGSRVIEEMVMNLHGYSYTHDIIWRSPDGREVSFKNFLPSDKYHFAKRLDFLDIICYDFWWPERIVHYGNLSYPCAFFSLLHEIGHAHIWDKTKDKGLRDSWQNFEKYTTNLENRQLTKEDIKKRGEDPKDYVYYTAFAPKGKEGKEYVEDPEDHFFEMLVPRKLVEEYGRALAQIERDAWAFSLKTLRKLKREKLILEPNLKLEDFENKIYSYLETYEEYLRKEYKIKGKYFTKKKKFKKVGLI